MKANQRVSATDLRGLRKLREALGARFMAGIAFSGTRRGSPRLPGRKP